MMAHFTRQRSTRTRRPAQFLWTRGSQYLYEGCRCCVGLRGVSRVLLHVCRSVYEVSVEPELYGQKSQPPPTQRMQVIIPGPVDPPEIFLRSVNERDFTIEWGEPRCYGNVKVRGYQLYLNKKKVGRLLSSTHRKAVVPCRPNRSVGNMG